MSNFLKNIFYLNYLKEISILSRVCIAVFHALKIEEVLKKCCFIGTAYLNFCHFLQLSRKMKTKQQSWLSKLHRMFSKQGESKRNLPHILNVEICRIEKIFKIYWQLLVAISSFWFSEVM